MSRPRSRDARATAGQVQTVLGALERDDLGIVLPHEHLLGTFGWPEDAAGQARAPMSLESLWSVNANPYLSRDNLTLDDRDAAAGELEHYRALGGGAIVELTTRGLAPDPDGLRLLSVRTGVPIVAGTGWYVATHRGPEFAALPEQDVAEQMAADIRDGFPGTNVRAGIIGELGIGGLRPRSGIGRVGELGPGDQKLLGAAARAQRATGAAISIHSPKSNSASVPHATLALGLLDVLEAAGADLTRVVIGHLDRASEVVEGLLAIARRGAYVELDSWGSQGYVMPDVLPYPADQVRVNASKALLDAGWGAQLLWSHDVCERRQWHRWGAGGFGHLLSKLPPILRRAGIDDEAMDLIMRRNPARLLPLASPQSELVD